MIFGEKSIDKYEVSKYRITLTEEQLQIPGLRMIGKHTIYDVLPSLGWHYHENAFEFSVPAKGAFTFVTPEKKYDFSLGDVFISFPNEIHGTNHEPVSLGELYWFQLDVSREQEILFLCPEASELLISGLKKLSHHVVHHEISGMRTLVEKAFYAACEGKRFLAAAYVQLYLQFLVESEGKEQSAISPNLQRVLEEIEKNIAEDISLEALANVAGLSCSQFKQNFKKEVGVSPRSYINKRKIEYGKNLLKEGKTVTEAAMALHFSSSNYFSSVFKKYTLCTPSEYVGKNTDEHMA